MRMQRRLDHTTARGTKVALTAGIEHNCFAIYAEISGVKFSVTETSMPGQPLSKRFLAGTGVFGGQARYTAIEITPEIHTWLRAAQADYRAEKKAIEDAELKVFFTNRATWEGDYYIVDGRLTDDEIIASLPAGVLAAATADAFRAGLAEARAKKAAKAAAELAKADRLQAATAEAKATGRPVELRRYMADCDRSAHDCSTDLVIESVMPDGRISTERIHTY